MAEQSQGAGHVALGQVHAHQAEEAVRLRGRKHTLWSGLAGLLPTGGKVENKNLIVKMSSIRIVATHSDNSVVLLTPMDKKVLLQVL